MPPTPNKLLQKPPLSFFFFFFDRFCEDRTDLTPYKEKSFLGVGGEFDTWDKTQCLSNVSYESIQGMGDTGWLALFLEGAFSTEPVIP